MQTETVNLSSLFSFFEKQMVALNASKKFKFLLYGGSVGSGKSYFLRWACIYHLLSMAQKYQQTGIRAGLFCEDYPSLNDRHLSKIKSEFPDWLGTYNEQRHEFTLHPDFGAGVLCFRNLDDPSKYLSVEFAIEAVDEVNRNPLPTFTLLRTRLRWPKIAEVKFIAACNPLGEAWVKNFWVKRLFPDNEKEDQEFFFVKALPTDNPHLDPSYFKSLESLPEAERRAYLEGDWDAFEGATDTDGYVRLITDNEIERAVVPVRDHAGYCVIGVDPAAGGDKSAIVLRSPQGMQVLFNQRLKDTMDLAGITFEMQKKYSASLIVVDNVGVGRGVYDRLKELGLEVRGYNVGIPAEKSEAYKNLKAELFWKMRLAILGGLKLMRSEGWNELQIMKYKPWKGLIELQPKEQLLRKGLPSPGVADAAALTFAVSDSSIKNAKLRKTRYGYFYDAMDSMMAMPGEGTGGGLSGLPNNLTRDIWNG